MNLAVLAERIGGLTWVSEQLFGLEGRWAEGLDDPAAVAHLATFSRHHGWHAGLWRQALPDSPALDAEELIGPPSPGWRRAVEAAASFDEGSDVQRLAALYRSLLPEALALIDDFTMGLGGPGDAHLLRVARLVQPDVALDAQRGYRWLSATMGDDADIESALSVTMTLDRAFRTC
ncbi:MAG: hypothetical protein ACR2N9_09575 [Acidimicrobiia bacterium]